MPPIQLRLKEFIFIRVNLNCADFDPVAAHLSPLSTSVNIAGTPGALYQDSEQDISRMVAVTNYAGHQYLFDVESDLTNQSHDRALFMYLIQHFEYGASGA